MDAKTVLTLTVHRLKDKLTELGLDTKGRKAQLQDRLLEHFGLSDEASDNEHNGSMYEDVAGVAQHVSTVPPSHFTLRDIEDSMGHFTGVGYPDVGQWVKDFEDNAFTLQWNELQKYVYAKQLLKGDARAFARTQSCICDWNTLKDALHKEFGKKMSAVDVHRMLQSRRKKPSETLREYLYKIIEIGNGIHLDEESLIEYFVQGIPDSWQNKSVLCQAQTIEELKNHIKVYEKIKVSKSVSTYSKSNQHNVAAGKVESGSKGEELTCFKCGTKWHIARNCSLKGLKCFKCNQVGHRANECETKQQGEVKNKEVSGKEKNGVHMTSGYEVITLSQSGNRVFKDFTINDITLSALIDTGSDISAIRYDTPMLLGEIELKNETRKFTGIGGAQITTMGSFTKEVEIDNLSLEITFHVAKEKDILYNAVIGNDVLKLVDIFLSDEGAIFQLKNKTAKFTFEKGANLDGREQGEIRSSDDPKSKNHESIRELSEEFKQICISTIIDEQNRQPDYDLGHLSDVERNEVEDIIRCYTPNKCVFSPVEMKIILKDEIPVYSRPRGLPISDQGIVEKQIKVWLNEGIVRQSSSEFASPIVLAGKKDGTKRLCCDYRRLNEKIVRDNFPMILIDDVLQRLEKAVVFTTLDLRDGFFHVPVEPEFRKYTSFITHNGQYEFNVVPFGICNSPAVFCRFIAAIFRELTQDGTVVIYMDDIIIPSKDEREGILKFKKVLGIAEAHGLRIKWSKCQFLKRTRHKSMQPDSECNKRIRLKQGTTATKDSTPKTVAETLTKTQTAVNNNTPKSSKRQTDISQFFRKLATPITTDDNNVLPGSTTAITLSQDIPESPATQLLNRIENNTFTPLQPRRAASETNSTTRSIAISIKSSNSGVASQQTVISAGSKKSLQFPTPTKRTSPRKKIMPLITPKKPILQRRTSVQQMPVAPSTSTPSLQTTESLKPAGPMTRRRSSIHSTINMSLSTFAPNTTDALLTSQAKQKQFSAIAEENNEGKIAAANITSQRRNSRSPRSPRGSPKSPKVGGGAVAKRRIIRRRTTYTQKTPDMSPPEKSPEKPKAAKTPNKRRTLYTPRLMEDNASSELSLTKINAQSKVLDENLLQFALTPTTTLIGSSQESITDVPPIIAAGGRKANNIEPGALIEEHASAMVFNSTRLPSANRRRTLFDVSMDIIQQRLHNINNSARRSVVAKDFTTTASNDIQSPSILPPTTTTTNSLLSATKCTNVVEVDAPTTPATTTTATNGTNSPPKTIKKRKLFVPNDTSLILTATPPTTSSAKKANTADATSAKRRRTITPRVLTNSRKSIATTNTKSEVIIKPPQAAPHLIANLTKNAVQSVPMLANNNAMQLAVTRKEGGGFAGKGGETSLTQLKLTATKISSKIELSCPTLNAKCITTFDTTEKLPTPTAAAGGGLTANELKKVVNTTTMLPQVKGSFVSIISSKASDTTIKQQLILQQKHDIIEVDENVAINSPHTETADYMQSTTTTAITTTSATTHTSVATISQQLVTTTSQPKVVKKSQMSAIPDTIKDAVVVGAAGSCTQPQRNTENGGKKKWPYIVCTNMHREQIKVMREAIATLGGLQLSHFVNDQTTHVISFEPRRTLNLLRALIRGLWILDYKWVLDSLKAGHWLNEEEYELRTFSRAVEICRTERQAFGKTYKCELFSDLGTFYISSRCGPISKDNLKELIELCGGKVVDQRKRAKYILGDPHKTLEDKIYVTTFWVLDSITQMQVMRQQKYAYVAPTSLPTKTQQTQLPQSNMIDVVSLN